MIQPGDLVVVVRACCESRAKEGLGWVFTATHTNMWHGGVCGSCGTPFSRQVSAQRPSIEGLECAPESWLLKIPPLTEEESTEGVESVKC